MSDAGHQQFPPPPPPPGPAGFVPDTRPTDGFAIAALVLGILGGVGLGIIFGIVGLVRTKGGRRKGRGLAIAGIALSAVWTIVLVGAVVFAVMSQPARDAGGQVTDPGRSSFADVQVGDCVADVTSGVEFGVDVVPCDQPHDGQVFAMYDLPDGPYPGDEQVFAQSEEGCGDRVPAQWLDSPEIANLRTFLFHPREASWASGDREVICAVITDTPTTGSLPGLGG